MAKPKTSKGIRRVAIHEAVPVNSSIEPAAKRGATRSQSTTPESTAHFRFLDLPAELRIRIYEEVLTTNTTIDLGEFEAPIIFLFKANRRNKLTAQYADPDNYRRIYPRLGLFLVSKTVHEEAYRVFYAQPLRLFPTHGRFFHTKKPLLARLNQRYRHAINTVEMVLGPGWTAPPKCQCVQPSLGLDACTNLRTLKIFVTCDPSDSIYYGFRGKNATEDTYKWFCVDLLQDFIDEVPSLETVEVDANTSLRKDAPLIVGLVNVIRSVRLRLVWGPTILSSENDEADRGCHELRLALASLSLNDATNVVQVEA